MIMRSGAFRLKKILVVAPIAIVSGVLLQMGTGRAASFAAASRRWSAVASPQGITASKFTSAKFKGTYGCLLQLEHVVSQTMQITVDGKGGIAAGTVALNFEGEVCKLSVQPASSYTVGSDGTGFLSLVLATTGNNLDQDGDQDCTALFSGASFGENFAMVLESGGKRVEFTGNDPVFTGSQFTSTDSGDFLMNGFCNAQ